MVRCFEQRGEVKVEPLLVQMLIDKYVTLPVQRVFGLLNPIHSNRVEGFIPDDGVICDNASLSWMVSCFRFLQLGHDMPEEVKLWTKTDGS